MVINLTGKWIREAIFNSLSPLHLFNNAAIISRNIVNANITLYPLGKSQCQQSEQYKD